MLETVGTWTIVALVVLAMLAVDLVYFGRGGVVTLRSAAWWSVLWAAIGLAFAGGVWVAMGQQAAGEYLAGYLIERALSLDNVFVFVLILSAMAVPAHLHQRALLWGVIGALVLRILLIAAGVALIQQFSWVLYVFGVFLVWSGFHLFRHRKEPGGVDIDDNRPIRIVRRLVRTSPQYDGTKVLTHHDGRWHATPLLAVLAVIAVADIMFAVDSIPAIFGVTTDGFIVVMANVFALLGLRALYFLVAGMMDRFVYLEEGLSLILVLVGLKMLVAHWFHPPIWGSLAAVAAILVGSIALSLYVTRRQQSVPPANVPLES